MNYTILVMGCLAAVMVFAWILEGRESFSPPKDDITMIGMIPTLSGLNTDDPEMPKERELSFMKSGKVMQHTLKNAIGL